MTALEDLRALLAGPVEEVAPRLLGCRVEHAGVTVRLTEVEAYGAGGDPGSHAHRGHTRRNGTMFGPPGRLYCYLSYGVHVCANVVTGPDGSASAVLLRAGEVVAGEGTATERRRGARHRDLARGPARLCQALGLGLDHDGADLVGCAGPRLRVGPAPSAVRSGPRVGLTAAPDRPWRFWEDGAPTVSPYRRSPRAAAPDSRPSGGGC